MARRLTCVCACAWLSVLAVAGHGSDTRAEQEALLALHEEFKSAHMRGDADTILRRLAEDYVRVGRGEVTHPEHADMAARMQDYLGRTTFSEYRDLRPPIARVSADGTLGWVVVELEAKGVQVGPDGTEEPLEFVCAWVSLFEKRDGEWVITGDVSTFRP